MISEIEEQSQEMRRILTRMKAQAGQIMHEYAQSRPAGDFTQEVLNPTLEFLKRFPDLSSILDDTSILDKLSIFVAGDKDKIESDIAFLHFSCFYATASLAVLDPKERDLAWDLICRAELFLGAAIFTNRGEEITTKAVSTLLAAERGSNGRKKRTEIEDGRSKEIVYETFCARDRWDSLSGAIRAARKALVLVSAELDRTTGTVGGWIKGHPDLVKRIPTLPFRQAAQQRRPAKNNKTQTIPRVNSIWPPADASEKGGSSG